MWYMCGDIPGAKKKKNTPLYQKYSHTFMYLFTVDKFLIHSYSFFFNPNIRDFRYLDQRKRKISM